MTTRSTTNPNPNRRTRPFVQVLVPTDGGSGTEPVIDTALEIATTYGATIHVLYVVDTRSELGHWDYVIEQRERDGERAVETIATRGLEQDIEVVVHIRYGTPHDAICAYVDDHDIDLVIMGTHGRKGFQRFLHAGSVTERVLRGTIVPVLVVRLGDNQAET